MAWEMTDGCVYMPPTITAELKSFQKIQVEQWHVRATIEARHIDQTGTYVFHFPYPDKLIIKKPDGKKLTFHPRKKK